MNPVFVIIHISDLHFGRSLKRPSPSLWRNFLGISEHSFQLAVGINNTVDRLRAQYGPENIVVMITGDQTTSANAAAFEEVHNYLNGSTYISRTATIGLELRGAGHTVPGNHDMFLRSINGSPNRSKVYGEYFDNEFPSSNIWRTPLGYVTLFKLDSNRVSRFNFLNFRNLSFKGEIGEPQRGDLQALAGELRNEPPYPDYVYDDSLKIVLLHHHLARNDQSGPTSALIDALEVIDLFADLKIDLALCGHEHEPYFRTVGTRWPFKFSCAGSACKEGERINSFKVYYVERFDRIFVEEHTASTVGALYTFLSSPISELA